MSSFLELHFTLLLACSVPHVTASIVPSFDLFTPSEANRAFSKVSHTSLTSADGTCFPPHIQTPLLCLTVCFPTTRLPQHDGAEVSKWLTIPIQARRLATRDQTTARQIAVRSNPPRARRRLLHGLHSSHRTSQDTQIMINIQGR